MHQPSYVAPVSPGGVMVWMARPAPIAGVPPGLEYLSQINSLKVRQVVNLLEAFTGWEENNKYAVLNAAGQQVYYAMEDTETCMRLFCGARRGFTIYIVDNTNQKVAKLTREFKCFAGCCWFAGTCEACTYEVQVEAPIGQVVGYVVQAGSCFPPVYQILDENRNHVLTIDGPCCIVDGPFCPVTNHFNLLDLEGKQVGSITKEYSGFVREMFTNADTFGMAFPLDLAVKAKATLFGALFLIDFMFFEDKNKNNNQ